MGAQRKGQDNPQAHSGSGETCEVRGASSGSGSASGDIYLSVPQLGPASRYSSAGSQVCLQLQMWREANNEG